jgi:uncharacterized membrane protein
MALALFFPGWFRSASKRVSHAPLKTFGLGLLSIIIAPIICIAIALTLIGIPLTILLVHFWMIVLMLSGPSFAYYIGRLVWATQANALLTMLIGTLIVLIVLFIPIIGIIEVIAILTLGVGTVVNEIFARFNKPIHVTKTK